MTEHLTREQLLRYVDGELSKSGMTRTAEHLHACWACRTELDRLQDHIATILDAEVEVLEPSMPTPPKPWPGLEAKFHAAMNHSAGLGFWNHIIAQITISLKPRLPFLAAASVFAVVLLLIAVQPSPISAKEALRRSVAADSQRMTIAPHQVIRQRVHVKKTGRMIREESAERLETWKSVRSTCWAETGPISAELLDRYKKNGLLRALPLSPDAQAGWMQFAVAEPAASRKDGTVQVRAISNDTGRTQGLEAIRLRMRESDWHLDQMTLSFHDVTYQLTEEDSSILDQSDVPSDVLAFLEPPAPRPMPRIAVPTPAAPVLTGAPEILNLDDVEMSVRMDLHSMKADLGESIEISIRKGQVVVNAWNIASERRAELAAHLENRRRVALEFQPPAGGAAVEARTVIIPDLAPVMQPRDERLLKFFGSAEAEENYTRFALDAGTAVLARYYALRALADRWPAGQETRLSPGARSGLAELVQDHANEVHAGLMEMKGILNLMLSHFGKEIRFDSGTPPHLGWREASLAGLNAARSVDQILRALLTTSATQLSLDKALPKLQQAIEDLERIARAICFHQDIQIPT